MEAAKYDEVFDYLRGSQYPKDADKNKKRSVRQRAAMFALENDVVVLKGTSRQWITCTEHQQQIIRSCCLGKCLRVCIQKLYIHLYAYTRYNCERGYRLAYA